MCLFSQKRKNDFKKKKREFNGGERNARGNEPHQPPPPKLGVDRTRERKKTGTDGGQPRADDAFREEEEEKEEINDEQHFGRREGEDVECGRCL
tara:strand:+ start:27 stop:308 length:282 start_codon:yes stop_codon:yes gene_type:complete